MNDIDKNNLLYVCALIEFLGRKTKNRRADIVRILGKEELKRQFALAEVNHCLSFEEVSDEIIDYFNIEQGNFDTVAACKYDVPNFLAIGKVYHRIIVDIDGSDIGDEIYDVFSSFISDEISNFNSSVYYSSPDYLKHSYLEGRLLE